MKKLAGLIYVIETDLNSYLTNRPIWSDEDQGNALLFSFFPMTMPLVLPLTLLLTGFHMFRYQELVREKNVIVREAINSLTKLRNSLNTSTSQDNETTLEEIKSILDTLENKNHDLHSKYGKNHKTALQLQNTGYTPWKAFWGKSWFQSLLSKTIEKCQSRVELFSNASTPYSVCDEVLPVKLTT